MFTGIVTAVGTVEQARTVPAGRECRISSPWSDLRAGESIAVDGACLTVARHGEYWFEVDVVGPSLSRTNVGGWAPGRRVNLERAVRAGDRLGGHLVQGHVDGVGLVTGVERTADAVLMDVQVPGDVAKVVVPLGSIAVDGVSLTVNAIPAPGTVQISLVPHTLDHTTLGERRVGDAVHVEGDLIGKYVAGLLESRSGV